jgi:hypothetical protein
VAHRQKKVAISTRARPIESPGNRSGTGTGKRSRTMRDDPLIWVPFRGLN